MSAESGVPTFRDAQGWWNQLRPEDVATPEAFARDPETVWAWYRARRQALAQVAPHAGYGVLAGWEARFAALTIVTQNVDGLHRRAGATNVIELHGRLDSVRCISCRHMETTLADLGPAPHCPECGDWLRPGVVWFGELLPADALEAAAGAAAECDVFLLIGTSGTVYPAAGLIDYAAGRGAAVIEINPTTTPLSGSANTCLRDPCSVALLALERHLVTGT